MMFLDQFRLAIFVSLSLCSIFGSGNVLAWTEVNNCEGTNGVKVPELFSLSSFSTEQVKTGSTSCRLAIAGGSDGWASFGGTMMFPEMLQKGDELWIRLNIYVPESFDYTASPALKFMRVHTRTPAGENLGYLDLYFTPDGPTHWNSALGAQDDSPYYWYYEALPKTQYPGDFEADRIRKGTWESFEIYYKFDDVAVDNGGTGLIRIWKNNKLLANYTDQVTLYNSETLADSFFLFTYYNGNAPKDQHLYVDNIIRTTDQPTNVDSNGYKFIGGDEVIITASPNPPSSLSVERLNSGDPLR